MKLRRTVALSALMIIVSYAAFAQSYGQVSPTSLGFGSVLIGKASPPMVVTLKNTGSASMTVPSVSASTPFAVSVNKCQKAIKAGASCKVWIIYTPQVAENDTGTLTFGDNASNSPQTVSLSGTGTTFQPLYQFPRSGSKGVAPQGALSFDVKGNVYGTTETGGSYGFGTVFRLSPSGTETLLRSFAGQPRDGEHPMGGLVSDAAGNLYGVTWEGGSSTNCPSGCGTVFKLTPSGTETVLHAFTGPPDGAYPNGRLVLDAQGNLYGTTVYGGSAGDPYDGYGTVFKVTPNGSETVLYSFIGWPDGENPAAGLTIDEQGNLYGASQYGGSSTNCAFNEEYNGCGTVFRITPDGAETVLYSFTGYPNDGMSPTSALVFNPQGNLYGTTLEGGPSGACNGSGCGTVFELTPNGSEVVIYSFAGYPSDGSGPYGDLLLDQEGNLYGTTPAGGASTNCAYGCGTAFKLIPSGVETLLHTFTGTNDGSDPLGGLAFNAQDTLYGTTIEGGAFQKNKDKTCYRGCGLVFQLAP